MRSDERFNLRPGTPIDIQEPYIISGRGLALGMTLVFSPKTESSQHADLRRFRIHMTPDEAIDLGLRLISQAREEQKK